MELSTASFLVLITLLALNRLLVSVMGVARWKWLFWPIQVLNLATAVVLIPWGLPGMPPGLRMLDWFISMLFVLHIVENNRHRQRVLEAREEHDNDSLEQRREAIRSRLERKDPVDSPDPTSDPDPEAGSHSSPPPDSRDSSP